MRTETLFAIVPLLATATVSARLDRRNRDHRVIADRLVSRGSIFDVPEHDADEVLVKILPDPPGPEVGQSLTFDGNSFAPISTAHPPTSTGLALSNKVVVAAGSDGKSDQVGAASYQQPNPQTPAAAVPASGGEGVVAKEEVDEWLIAHNVARSQHGAGQIQWSENLAIGAKSNAIQCRGEHT